MTHEYVAVLHAPDGYTDWTEARGYPTREAARIYAEGRMARDPYWHAYSIYKRIETGKAGEKS